MIKKLAVTAVMLAVTLIVEIVPVPAENPNDSLMKSCSDGDQEACDKLRKLVEEDRLRLERLNAQADAFQADARDLGIQIGRRPDLEKAYPLILHRYLNSDAVQPTHRRRELDERLVSVCSKSFHNYWLVERKEWPILPSGDPNWSTIYLMTLDHYFRHCVK